MNNQAEAAETDPRPGAYRARWVAALCEIPGISKYHRSDVIAMAFDATWLRLELCGRAAELTSKPARMAGTAAYDSYIEQFRRNNAPPRPPAVLVPFADLLEAAAESILNPTPVPEPTPAEAEAWRQVIYEDQLYIARRIGVLNKYLYLRGPWDNPADQPEDFLTGGFTNG